MFILVEHRYLWNIGAHALEAVVKQSSSSSQSASITGAKNVGKAPCRPECTFGDSKQPGSDSIYNGSPSSASCFLVTLTNHKSISRMWLVRINHVWVPPERDAAKAAFAAALQARVAEMAASLPEAAVTFCTLEDAPARALAALAFAWAELAAKAAVLLSLVSVAATAAAAHHSPAF